MTAVGLWAVILGGMVVTYALRLSFIVFFPVERLPSRLRLGLRHVPAAVLSALVLPALLAPQGALDLSIHNDRVLAGMVALLVGWRARNLWATIAAGMVALLFLNSI